MRTRDSRLSFGRRLLAILFPERCAACGEVIAPGTGVCAACLAALPRVGTPVCPFCGLEKEWCRCRKRKRHFDRVVASFYYDGVASRGVLRMKESGDRPSAAFFAAEMAESVRQHYPDISFDGVVFVPSGRKMLRQRGFNPGELLAQELADMLGLPLLPALIKVVENAPQKSLSAIERSGNVLGVFDVAADCAVAGKTLLLADDIVTTGTTLDECAKMLKIYGAQAVYAVAATAARPETDEETVQ